MPRIPDELLERIKAEISLVMLAERFGVELKPVGHELMGRCPFRRHEDTTPSLSINRERNVFQCFGCGAAGTPIDWTMLEKGLDFRQAVEVLVRDFFPGVAREVLDEPSRSRRSRAPELPCPFTIETPADDQTTLKEYVDQCRALLRESADAQASLKKREIDDAEAIARFAIGYQDRTLGLRLPTPTTKAGREVRERFQRLGLIRASGHAHFTGSVVIPTIDLSGNVTGIYGRKICDTLNKNHASPAHLYLPGEEKDIFNEEAFVAGGAIVLNESRIDAISFWENGHKSVTACRGVHISEAMLAAFVRYGIERCYIAFDRDDAGDRGALSVAEKLIARGVACYRVLFPKEMDANDVIRKMKPADKTLDLFIRSAVWMGGGTPPKTTVTLGDAAGDHEATEEKSGAAEEGISEKAAPEAAPLGSVDRFAQGEAHEDAVSEATQPGAAPAAPAPEASAVSSSPTSPTSSAPAPSPATSEAWLRASHPGLVKLGTNEALFAFEDRRYRVHELSKGLSYGSLKVSLKAERKADLFAPPSPICGWHMDTLDLATHRARALFEKQAAHEMAVREDVIHLDLGKVLSALEDVREKRIAEALQPKAKPVTMTQLEHEEALALAKDPQLIVRILEAFAKAGIVGEAVNALVLYLATVSRKLDRPLAVVIRSSSAAGKTALMDAVLSFVPDEEQERYSALTENVLFYFEGKDFKHKVLAIAEEQGAQRASYPLKLLQSEGQVTAASTGKDPTTGRLDAKEYKVEGPVMILLASTAAEMDEEFLNRCLVLTVDESREQTKRIHELQREAETLEGFLAKSERTKLTKLHQSFQRLLRPLAVFNPFSRDLTFLDDQTRTRRDHPKYLALIRSIALLHQHQREVHTCLDAEGKSVEYILVTKDDIALANRLAGEVLGHSLHELPPQTRKLLVLIHEWVRDECERNGVERQDFLFTRRQVRERLRWGDTQMRIHLSRLQEMEYLLAHRGGRGQSFVFELLYEGQGQEGERFLLGLGESDLLADVPDTLDTTTTTRTPRGLEATSRGWEAHLAGSKRPESGASAGGSRGDETSPEPAPDAALRQLAEALAEKVTLPPSAASPSSNSIPRRNGRNGRAIAFNLLRFPPVKEGVRRQARPRNEPVLA